LEAVVREMLEPIRERCGSRIADIRGRGLMWGIELVDARGRADGTLAGAVVAAALRKGVVLLCAGPAGNVLQLAPPLVIAREQLRFGIEMIGETLAELTA
jgi:4-aminobutyrate aminotransferase-like enzyme